ncbi:DUF2567 domain-containing protein [Nakamurella endophytica]|uniref:DUF2567 domain-containing protein n=1 Tax=Nakamurella endophytica TaxID=1748367 RepID=A0A917WLL8_9ACTN|nr:DUF2567 domain-containing protein [Nakamurella endophytica]GGM12386.1 hypothetical protein GCM10011594_35340 [Nakamurella endophytica]
MSVADMYRQPTAGPADGAASRGSARDPVDRLRAELRLWRFGGVLLAACVLLGVGQAVLWAALAPGEQFQVAKDGGYAALPTESVHQWTSVAMFAVLGIVVGVCVAVAAWGARSVRGTVALVAVGVANGVGALTGYLVGRVIAPGVDPASVGASSAARLVFAPPVLGNAMVVLAQPALAVVTYTVLVLWNGQPDLGRSEGRRGPDAAGDHGSDPEVTGYPDARDPADGYAGAAGQRGAWPAGDRTSAAPHGGGAWYQQRADAVWAAVRPDEPGPGWSAAGDPDRPAGAGPGGPLPDATPETPIEPAGAGPGGPLPDAMPETSIRPAGPADGTPRTGR